MANDSDDNNVRDLRSLAKRYKITIHSPSSTQKWPAAYHTTFQSISNIGNQRFASFTSSIDIRSDDEPWREQIKHRAARLAKRATELVSQQRNEAGWRAGIENDVLHRFRYEVAWLVTLQYGGLC
jgi:hypothetical protein